MPKTEYPKGIYLDEPRQGAPDYVKGKVSIKGEVAIPWIQEKMNEKGYVNLDLLENKEGELYLKVNDWKPNGERRPAEKPRYAVREHTGTDGDLDDQIPF